MPPGEIGPSAYENACATEPLASVVVTPVRDQQVANRTGDDAATPQAAAEKVKMLMERLKAGANFAELAMGYSEDPETAPRGGDLGLGGLHLHRVGDHKDSLQNHEQ